MQMNAPHTYKKDLGKTNLLFLQQIKNNTTTKRLSSAPKPIPPILVNSKTGSSDALKNKIKKEQENIKKPIFKHALMPS
ncbi:hypothetical protein ACOBV9_07605 [Pseudoalteromonas espejiana]